MTRFHINPETGNVGLCRAKTACPFGDDSMHFPTQAAAREGYEAIMVVNSIPSPRPGHTLTKSGEPISREEAEKLTDELHALAREQGKKLREMQGESTRERKFDRDAMDEHFRMGMIDTLEGRSGEKWPKGTMVRLRDGSTHPAEAIGAILPPGEYIGTTIDPESGKVVEATVAVYGTGVSRAFKQDVRDNLEKRVKLAQAKRLELEVLTSSLRRRSEEEEGVYGETIRDAHSRIVAAGSAIDWSDPKAVSEVLDVIDTLEYEVGQKANDHEDDVELEGKLRALHDELFEAVSGAYELHGR